MKISINIPDDKKVAVVNAFATQYKYQASTTDEEGVETQNPVSKGQFALNIIKTFIKEVYISSQVQPLQDQRKTLIEKAKTDIDGVEVV